MTSCAQSCENRPFPHTKSQAEVTVAVWAGASTQQLTAEITGCSQRTVQRVLKLLAEAGACRLDVRHSGGVKSCEIVKLASIRWIGLLKRCRERLGNDRFQWLKDRACSLVDVR